MNLAPPRAPPRPARQNTARPLARAVPCPPGPWARGTVALALLLAGLLAAGPARSAEVPPRLGLLLMLKALTYDRHFDERGTGPFDVVVVEAPGRSSARELVGSVTEQLEGQSIHKRPLRLSVLPLSRLSAAIAAGNADAVLLLPELDDREAEEILDSAREARIYALSLSERHVERGAGVGVKNERGRPKLLLNLSYAAAIGADYAPSILRLAQTYR